MDEGVDPIGQFHEQRVSEEELLDGHLPEQSEGLLDPNKLQRMSPRDVDGSFL
jgi:hypothetical protein